MLRIKNKLKGMTREEMEKYIIDMYESINDIYDNCVEQGDEVGEEHLWFIRSEMLGDYEEEEIETKNILEEASRHLNELSNEIKRGNYE